jgi:hypothetical protein
MSFFFSRHNALPDPKTNPQGYFDEVISRRNFAMEPSFRARSEKVPKGHESITIIANFLSIYAHRVNINKRYLLESTVDEELLRLLLEHGLDVYSIDQRVLWSYSVTAGPKSPLSWLVCGMDIDMNYSDPAFAVDLEINRRSQFSPTMSDDILNFQLQHCGEIPQILYQSPFSLSMTPNSIAVLCSMVELSLASPMFFDKVRRHLQPFRGSEELLLLLLDSNLLLETRERTVQLAAQLGHLKLLRRVLDCDQCRLLDNDTIEDIATSFPRTRKRTRQFQVASLIAGINSGSGIDIGNSSSSSSSSSNTIRTAMVELAMLSTTRLDVLLMLIQEFGGNVNCIGNGGKTILMDLCREPSSDSMKTMAYLLSPNSGFYLADVEHAEDGTALDIAMSSLNFSAVNLLLSQQFGYNLPLTKKEISANKLRGRSLLTYCCASKHLAACSGPIISHWVGLGAGVDSRDRFGDTALIVAVQNGQWDIAHTLIRSYGASLSTKNASGLSALTIAKTVDKVEAVKLTQEEKWCKLRN